MGRGKFIFLMIALATTCAIITYDFITFCARAAELESPEAPKADAVIALTGGSGLRIAASVRLIEAGSAEHLLISGVHPDVTLKEIHTLGGGSLDVYRCCVDLGYAAETTYGNAEESARWARTGGYQSLIIVTSNYHMPRSLILLRRAMPQLDLIPYPVQSRINPSAPFKDFASTKGLSTEWLKWRITRALYFRKSRAPEAHSL